MAATKDWGPNFKAVSDLMARKSGAVAANEANLKSEIANHTGHAYGRHGAQTGWEGQIIRAVTQVTPDQVFDPTGVNPSIRRWNGAFAMSNTDGSTVLDLFDAHASDPTAYAKSAGNVAGGFTTPEAQEEALKLGREILGKLNGAESYAAHYRFKNENRFVRMPFSKIHIVVGGKPGAMYGLGFARRDPKNYPTIPRDFVVACIDGFQRGLTWGQIATTLTSTTYKFSYIALRKNKRAFSSMQDLCDFFELDILTQKACSLIFRRQHHPGNNTHGPWTMVTMFPDDKTPGWAPSVFLDDARKAALVAAGFNRNADDYHWTGLITSRDASAKTRYPVPSWA